MHGTLDLTFGTRLGVYEVIAPIGEGGMGQVYRATDTTLGRQIAIKILPDAFASDPDRMARFEREAKTLGSLNHSPRCRRAQRVSGLVAGQHTRRLFQQSDDPEDLFMKDAGDATPERPSITRACCSSTRTAGRTTGRKSSFTR